jgi:hypothetical protein
MTEATKAYCNRCGGQTNHETLASDEHEDEEGFLQLFEMLKCRGCGTVTMRRTPRLSAIDEEAVYVEAEAVQYPPPIARRAPNWAVINYVAGQVDDGLAELMCEVYAAVQNGSLRLAAMGVRAVLKRIMIDKVGDHKSFIQNVDAFQAAGYLSIRQRNLLKTILEAGHASIHRGWNPTIGDMDTLLVITESVVQTVYFHEPRVSELEKKLPPRKRRDPSGTQQGQ